MQFCHSICNIRPLEHAPFLQYAFVLQAGNLDRKGTFKVEYLQKIEQEVQEKWEKDKIHCEDAPLVPKKRSDEKFFVTFPFPYMNGRLHLGHVFSLSKCEVFFFMGFPLLTYVVRLFVNHYYD